MLQCCTRSDADTSKCMHNTENKVLPELFQMCAAHTSIRAFSVWMLRPLNNFSFFTGIPFHKVGDKIRPMLSCFACVFIISCSDIRSLTGSVQGRCCGRHHYLLKRCFINLRVFCINGACFGFLGTAVEGGRPTLALTLALMLGEGAGRDDKRSEGLTGTADCTPVPCLACCLATLRGGLATVST